MRWRSRPRSQFLPSSPVRVVGRLTVHAIRPALLAAVGGAAVLLPFGWWFQAWGSASILLWQWTIGFLLSAVVHEASHVLAAPPGAPPQTWQVVSSWTGMAVLAPERGVARANAAAGPLAAAALCVLLAAAGWSWGPCAVLAAMHLVNLSPLAPDGRALAAAPARGDRVPQ